MEAVTARTPNQRLPVCSGPSFLVRMAARCDQLITEWLRRREVHRGLPGKIRTRILETVRLVFLSESYSALSLKAIAQLARVTEGSILRLFGSRVGLNQYVLQDTINKACRVATELSAAKGSANVTLADVARAMPLPENELRILFPTIEDLRRYLLPR